MLLLQLFMFYIFPLFCGPTDMMGMVVVILITTFILSLIVGGLSDKKLKWLWSIIVAILFIPSVLIYYNENALIHVVWYLIVASVGLGIGALVRFLASRFKK